MAKHKLKIYLDSTVPNYVLNDHYPEKQQVAKAIFEAAKKKQILVFISPVTVEEIISSSKPRRVKMIQLLQNATLFQKTPEAEELSKNYIKYQVFTKANREDARHVAYAVYYGIDIIASYNFSHIVRLTTIKKLQGVNLILGFRTPEISTPEAIDL